MSTPDGPISFTSVTFTLFDPFFNISFWSRSPARAIFTKCLSVHLSPLWNSSYCAFYFFTCLSQYHNHDFCSTNWTILFLQTMQCMVWRNFWKFFISCIQVRCCIVQCVLNLSEPTRRRRLKAVIRRGWTTLWTTSAESFVWCCSGLPLTPPTCRRRRALWPSSRSPSAHKQQGQCISSHFNQKSE